MVSVIGPYSDAANWQAVIGGIKRFAESGPRIEFDFVAPADDNAAQRDRIVRNCLERGPSAVILYVTGDAYSSNRAAAEDGSDPFPALIELIRPHVTAVITVGRQVRSAVVAGHVGANMAQAAELLGVALPEILGEKRSYVFLDADASGAEGGDPGMRFSGQACRHQELVELDRASSAKTARPAADSIRTMLAKFPHVGAVISLDPTPWLSLAPRQRLAERCRFATVTAVPALWPRLESGEAAALAGALDGDIGYKAAEMAWQALAGTGDGGRVVWVPCELVTSATLPDFVRRYTQSARLELMKVTP